MKVTVPLERLATLTRVAAVAVDGGADVDVAARGAGESDAGGVALDEHVGPDGRGRDGGAGDAGRAAGAGDARR